MSINLQQTLHSATSLITAAAILAALFVGGEVQPRQNIVEPIADAVDVPVVTSDAPGRCPSGWRDTSVEAEHAIVYRCERGGWTVILQPDLSFSHARQGDSGPFKFDQAKVPGW